MQVDALVILWGRLTDRAAMGAVLPTLSSEQLAAVLARLGHYHVLHTVDPPFGCRLKFDIIGNPDQEAAAKLLCKTAVEAQQARAPPRRHVTRHPCAPSARLQGPVCAVSMYAPHVCQLRRSWPWVLGLPRGVHAACDSGSDRRAAALTALNILESVEKHCEGGRRCPEDLQRGHSNREVATGKWLRSGA